MFNSHARFPRVASNLITQSRHAQSFQGRTRTLVGAYSKPFRKGFRISTSTKLHHQRDLLGRRTLSPPVDLPVSQASISKSASFVQFTCAVISISGIFLFLYATTNTNPRLLESWEQPENWNPADASEEDIDEIDRGTKYHPVNPVTSRQVDAILAWVTQSYVTRRAGDIFRFDSVTVPSNSENGEDRTSYVRGEDEEGIEWLMSFVYDGHVGSTTADIAKNFLPHYLVRHMSEASPSGRISDADPIALDKAIKEGFIELDQDIMNKAVLAMKWPEAASIPAVQAALAGSCAIVTYYNAEQRMLKTACVGDSRAVLGRFSKKTGKWEAIALSKDQTGHNEEEVLRLQREHPNEPGMIKDGRLLGLAVTRAFGDSRWKWSRELQELARDRFCGPELRDGLLTPPYLTAEPEITTTEIHPENGDFVIQASDGLWDQLTNAQAVDLVAGWLQYHDPSKGAAPLLSNSELEALANLPKSEPDYSASQKFSYRDPVKEEDFVVKDANAASHLARNALGGRNEARLRGVLSASAPYSRELRDDISVQVLFFGKDPSVISDAPGFGGPSN